MRPQNIKLHNNTTPTYKNQKQTKTTSSPKIKKPKQYTLINIK